MRIYNHYQQWITLLLITLFSLPLYAADSPKRGQITGGVVHTAPDWFKESFLEIADDVDEATDANKHVLLFFQLNGCPYCDRMLTEAFESEPLKSYIQEHFDVIAINVRGDRDVAFNEEVSVTEKELAEKLKVRATPGILFLNANNKPVVRVDGYRAPERFTHILNYVAEKAYENQKLAAYLNAKLKRDVYRLRTNPMFKDISDLSKVSGPLAVIFEDSSCFDCNEFHNNLLANPAVIAEMKPFTVVRLDTSSDKSIVGVDGKATTAKALADDLNMTYRPGVVMYADGKLMRRYDSLLFSHHFKEGFRWIGSGAYKTEDYSTYSDKRTEELLSSGITINLGK